MSDLDGIYPSYIYKNNICGPFDRVYASKMHGCAQISQYKIFDLFVVIKYTKGSRNIILDYTTVTYSMSCVKYRYKDKNVIVHMIIIT